MKTVLNSLLRQQLVRNYYFSEALAFYETYYAPLSESIPRNEEPDDRRDDRPVTWAPLLFHATTVNNLTRILRSGNLRPGKEGCISFTEMPLGELDRLITRKRGRRQIAIGFPRRVLQRYGFTSVWYLKHNPELQSIVKAVLVKNPQLTPYVDLTGDVGSFAEVRVTQPVPISEAVWILSSERLAPGEMPQNLQNFRSQYAMKYGAISTSFWHRSHLEGILNEWNYIRLRQQEGNITNVEIRGEHYWRMAVQQRLQCTVTLPDQEWLLQFTSVNDTVAREWEGPFGHFDTARYIERLLIQAGEDTSTLLQDRLIHFGLESTPTIRTSTDPLLPEEGAAGSGLPGNFPPQT